MSISLSQMSDEQLAHRCLDLERELVALRFKHGLGRLESTASLAVVRKGIAKVRTELRARELQQGLHRNALIERHRGSHQVSAGGGEQQPASGFLQGIVDRLATRE